MLVKSRRGLVKLTYSGNNWWCPWIKSLFLAALSPSIYFLVKKNISLNFSSCTGVAASVPFPEYQSRTESGLGLTWTWGDLHDEIVWVQQQVVRIESSSWNKPVVVSVSEDLQACLKTIYKWPVVIDHPIHPIYWFENIPQLYFAIQDMATLDKSRTRNFPE